MSDLSINRAVRYGVRAGIYSRRRQTWTPNGLVRWLARVLPDAARERFVHEVIGDLGMCAGWRQRAEWLASLIVGIPRLAWMMHHENRQGRA